MSSEKQMWSAIRDGLKITRWKYMRVEARLPLGVPDVCYQMTRSRTGWIELKHSSSHAKAGKVQQLPHFTIEQRKFLSEWPCTKLLWRIAKDWLLFDQEYDIIGHAPLEGLKEIAKWSWSGSPDWKLLAAMLDVQENISG